MTRLVQINNDLYDVNDICVTQHDANNTYTVFFKSGHRLTDVPAEVIKALSSFAETRLYTQLPAKTKDKPSTITPTKNFDRKGKPSCDHIWYTHDSDFAPIYNGEDLHLYLDMSGSIFYKNEDFSFIKSVLKEYIKIAQGFGVRLFVTEFCHEISEDQEIDVTAYGDDVDKILEYYMEHQFKGLYGGTDLELVLTHIAADYERTNEFSIVITDYELFINFESLTNKIKNIPEKVFYESYKELRSEPDTCRCRDHFITEMDKYIEGFEFHCDDT